MMVNFQMILKSQILLANLKIVLVKKCTVVFPTAEDLPDASFAEQQKTFLILRELITYKIKGVNILI